MTPHLSVAGNRFESQTVISITELAHKQDWATQPNQPFTGQHFALSVLDRNACTDFSLAADKRR